MSAETIVKKRGRPKKVIPDPIEVELRSPENKKPTSRAKSTKAVPSPAKAKVTASVKAPTSAKPPIAEKTVDTPSQVSKAAAAAAPTPNTPTTSAKLDSPGVSTKKTPVTPESSKILEQVRELPAKSASSQSSSSSVSKSPTSVPSKAPTAASTPQSKSTTTKPTSTINAAKSSTPSQSRYATPQSPSSSPPQASKSTSPPPKPKPQIPIAALNSAVVSNISERAGARPNVAHTKALPKNYNSAARKVTMAIVAMPIAIVTSYVLYHRLVSGDGRKSLVAPGLNKVESSPAEGTKSEAPQAVEN